MKILIAMIFIALLSGCGIAQPAQPGYRHIYYDIDTLGPRNFYGGRRCGVHYHDTIDCHACHEQI